MPPRPLLLTVLLALLLSFDLTAPILAADRPNIVLILCDDHRWDAMSMMGHPFLETPNLDRLAKGGAHFQNAFVTTSLCSPSRASILTGLYAHNHGVIDNYTPVDPTLRFFPEQLRDSGYETAFIGKWHMGDLDDPQRGFDHWVAFRGQGTYYPDGHGTTRVVPQTRYDGFNVNGTTRVEQKGYITDELTDYAIDWLKQRESKQPFFLYVSHKAVHSDFVPRDKDRNRYAQEQWVPPSTFANSQENRVGKPRWLINQRNSRHGVDYGYNLEEFEVETYYKRYCESLIAVDDNVGRLVDYLQDSEQLSQTLVVYLGDNGFQFGEHGLIDKRTAYEASIRVPLIMHYPNQIKSGTKIDGSVANIDLAPTLLRAAGLAPKTNMDGESFWDLATGKSEQAPRNGRLLYEYYWEWNYPQTPTTFAIRSDRYKFIRYHGTWDTDELYDINRDPDERNNLIRDPELAETIVRLKKEMFALQASSNGMKMPLRADRGRQFYNRHPAKSADAPFPRWFYEPTAPVTK